MRIGITILLTILTGANVAGQKLIDFKYSECSDKNPNVYKMNPIVNKMASSLDNLEITITWITGCSFDPKFSLQKVDQDTIYLVYKNKNDEEVFCACEYLLHFKLSKIKKSDYEVKINTDFKVKINNTFIDKNAKRYRTDGYTVEYFPERRLEMLKLREIYSENGKILAEVFYDKEGNVTMEKFYNNWGFFERERKY